MNVMDQTITGAASGETVLLKTAPKDSQSQVKGQKINQYILKVIVSWFFLSFETDWCLQSVFFIHSDLLFYLRCKTIANYEVK